jgi:ATP-dependent protease HslVU (ClpYQ) peptidase subunit
MANYSGDVRCNGTDIIVDNDTQTSFGSTIVNKPFKKVNGLSHRKYIEMTNKRYNNGV